MIAIPPDDLRVVDGEVTSAVAVSTLYALVHPDDVAAARALVSRATASPGVTFTGSLRMLHPDQLDVHQPVLANVTWRPDDRIHPGLVVRFDPGTSAGHDAADASSVALMRLQPTGEVAGESSPAGVLFDRLGDDRADDWRDWLRPEDRHLVEALVRDSATGTVRPPLEVGFDGPHDHAWVRLTVLPFRVDDGSVGGSLAHLVDITDEYEERLALARAREQLLHQARHDALTGLSNRIPFLEELSIALTPIDASPGQRRNEAAERRCAVVVCDLDGFKEVNDTYGHDRGDAVLREVARRLDAVVRAGDTLCRYGGDEFVVLCADVDPDRLDELAARLVDAVSTELVIDGDRHRLGISVGVALAQSGDEVDPDGLVRRADAAMYRAKRAGGQRAVVAEVSAGDLAPRGPTRPRAR
jgi:diguanylate cyclase (GGDEF)-like protein